MSQEAFSRSINISKGSLGFYERNENLPNVDVILKICSTAKVSLKWLLTGVGPMNLSALAENESSESDILYKCPRCAWLEGKLDRLEEERRELTAENRHLWKENAALRERCARLEERERQGSAPCDALQDEQTADRP